MSNYLTKRESIDLKKMINETECQNNTEEIRKMKHSSKIHADILRMEELKREHSDLLKSKYDEFRLLCQTECVFLYNNYMDIFNKVLKDELDLTIMAGLLTALKMIEDEKIDQHEGSVMVGRLLKKLYIDSALKLSDNLDKQHDVSDAKHVDVKEISWNQYKKMHK
jgi:hypothetical protein